MTGIMLLIAAVAMALAGCAYLALSQGRHADAVLGRGADWPMKKAARPLGWCLVMASLGPCVLRDGGGFAALLWPLILSAAAITVAMVIAYRPRWLQPLSGAGR